MRCLFSHVSLRKRHNGWVSGPRLVVIVVFDGVKLLDATGPAEVFAEANRFGADYQLAIASTDGCDVTTSIGIKFAVTQTISDAIFVRDGNVFTSAGVSSGIDLALALVEMDYGSELVREVARSLVVYLKRSGGQSQFSVLVEADPAPSSPLRPVTDAIAADPAGDLSVKRLAAHASLSTRQLTRLFQSELGTTPAQYVEAVRIDVARAALDAGHSIAETARLAGFGSPETLRRVFGNHFGLSPKAYRDRFHTAAGP